MRQPDDFLRISQREVLEKLLESPHYIPDNCYFDYYPDYGQEYLVRPKFIQLQACSHNVAIGFEVARPIAAAITCSGSLIILHPPVTTQLTLARVATELGLDCDPKHPIDPILSRIIEMQYPNACLAAGPRLGSEERLMSIAYVADLERDHEETARSMLAKVRKKLSEYGLIEDISDSTLEQYIVEGMILLRKAGLTGWEKPPVGRPRKKV